MEAGSWFAQRAMYIYTYIHTQTKTYMYIHICIYIHIYISHDNLDRASERSAVG